MSALPADLNHTIDGIPAESALTMRVTLKRLHRFRLLDLLTAVLAGSSCVVVPELKHSLAEVLDDVGAIEMDIFHQRATIFAVKNDMFLLPRWTAPLNHDAERLRRPLR